MTELFIASRTHGLGAWCADGFVLLDAVPGLNALAVHAPSGTLYGITGDEVLAWRVLPGQHGSALGARRIDRAPSGGDNSCHLLVLDRMLLIAHYGSGSVSCIPLAETGEFAGSASGLMWQGAGPDTDRQAQPHPHQLHRAPFAGVGSAGGVVVVDLGSDAFVGVSQEQLASATQHPGVAAMVEPERVPAPKGSGPRHAVALANGSVAVSAELSSELLLRDGSGSWRVLPSSIETGGATQRNYPSDIVAHPAGSVILANRGSDTVAFWSKDGEFRECAAGGRWPQSLLVADEQLLVACEHEDRVTAFVLDPETGMPLGAAREVLACPAPSWLLRA